MAVTSDDMEKAEERFEALLPWYVSGKIEADDRAFFEAHLGQNPECAQELKVEQALAQSIRDGEGGVPAGDADEAWKAFAATLPMAATAELPQLRKHSSVRSSKWTKSESRSRSMRWLVGMQSVAMLAMAVLIIPGQFAEPDASYQTLSGAESVERGVGNAVIKFSPGVSEAELRAILTRADAHIVNGPLADGSYLISIASDDHGAAVETLKSDNGVTLAESLLGESTK